MISLMHGFMAWPLVPIFQVTRGRAGSRYGQINPHSPPTRLWYDAQYSEADTLRGWRHVLKRYGKYWNLFGLDIKVSSAGGGLPTHLGGFAAHWKVVLHSVSW
jgi:hypothetical protein